MRDNHAGVPNNRLRSLDGLRAVAACSILVFHCWLFSSPPQLGWNLGPATPFMNPLQSGVTLFFVLSAFLLYLPIATRALQGKRPPPTLAYLRKRALRILPAYWVVLAIAGIVLGSATIRFADDGIHTGRLPASLLAKDASFIANFLPSSFGTGILPAWSLTIEVTFYLLLPVFGYVAYAGARRARSRRARTASVLVPPGILMASGIMLNGVASAVMPGFGAGIGSSWSVVLRQSFPSHAATFGIGMALAVAAAAWGGDPRRVPGRVLSPAAGRTAAYVGLPALFLGYYFVDRWIYDIAVAVLFAYVIARLVAPRSAPRRRRFLEGRVVAACGLASYSIFLWHYPLLVFFSGNGLMFGPGGAMSFLGNLVIVSTVTAGLSFATYRFVERPAMRWSRGRATSLDLRRSSPASHATAG